LIHDGIPSVEFGFRSELRPECAPRGFREMVALFIRRKGATLDILAVVLDC
jgi:hypothetical protein